MIVMIDNYDSFTYNLVDYLGRITDAEVRVFRNDKVTCKEIELLNPTHIVISPGPKTPKEAGVSKEVISTFVGKIPILGVCLGHQAMAEVFGGDVVGAKRLMHGKTSQVQYSDTRLFKGLPNPFTATRYHSLVVKPSTLPDCFKVTATSTDDQEIMAIEHKDFPLYGVQFHPESISSPQGLDILRNFLTL